MKNLTSIDNLRKKADRLFKESGLQADFHDYMEDVESLIEELNIHQIELHQQNQELQKSRQEIENERQKYSDLFHFAPVAYVIVNPKGIMEEVNQAAVNIFEQSRNQLIDRSIYFLIAKDDQSPFSDHFRNLLDSPQQHCTANIDLRIYAKKSKCYKNVRLQTAKHQNESQSLPQLTLSLIDITERETARKELIISEERYRQISENINDGIYSTNRQGVFVSVNQAMCDIFACPQDELLGKAAWELALPEIQQTVKEKIQTRIAQKEEGYVEVPCLRANGQAIHVEINAVAVGEYVYGVVREISERKKNEQKLILSEKKFRQLFELMPVLIAIVSIKTGKVSDVNPAMMNHTGYSREELVGQKASELKLWTPREFQKLRQAFKRKTNLESYEMPYFTKDKQKRHLLLSTVETEIDRKPCLMVAGIDISELISIRQQMKINEAKYRAIFNDSPMGITLSDTQGQIIESNREAERLLSLPAPEHQKRQIDGLEWQIIRLDGSPMPPNEFASVRALRENRFIDGVEMGILRGDKVSWINVTAAPMPIDQYGVIITYVDITPRIEARQALENSERKLRAILETIPNPIFLKDSNLRYTEVNKAAEEYFGMHRQNILNRTIFELIDQDTAQVYHQQDMQLLKKQEAQIEESYTYNKNKEKRDVIIYKSPLKSERGQIAGIVGLMVDITARKLAEAKIKSQNQELKALNATKDKLFSIVAHDLKNPFNTILGFAELLKKNHQRYSVDKRDKQLSFLLESVKNAYTLLENLLDWSRAQTGRLKYHPTVLPLQLFVDSCLELYYIQAKSKKITTEVAIAPKLQVYADANMLKTILRNLISNALKFTHQGGKLLIEAHASNDKITISVQDNGIGIPPDILPYMFKLDKTQSTIGTANEKGTGLGLLLTKEFIELHGGQIEVESRVDEGTRFWFYLPKA